MNANYAEGGLQLFLLLDPVVAVPCPTFASACDLCTWCYLETVLSKLWFMFMFDFQKAVNALQLLAD